jgi:hypothetical protein
MEAPQEIVDALHGIRSTFELRWNPRAKRVKPGMIGALGGVVPAEFEGRWELWDNPDTAPEHLIMVLRTPEDEFKPPGQWLVDLMNALNPARFGGDVAKVVQFHAENPNLLRELVHDQDLDNLLDDVGDECAWYLQLRGPSAGIPGST